MQTVNLDLVQLEENTTSGGPIRVAFPLHSAVGTQSTSAVLFELQPGSMLARHTDSAEEVLHVLDGEGEAEIGDERAFVRTGDVTVIPAMVAHSVRNVGRTPLRVLGVFSSSTVVATFDEPLAPDGPQVMVIGTPLPIGVALDTVPV
jgi:quercetin dioxygenase-like cupin family protein